LERAKIKGDESIEDVRIAIAELLQSHTEAGGVNQSIRGTRHDEKAVVERHMCWCVYKRRAELSSRMVC
jgi:hypothetical protein